MPAGFAKQMVSGSLIEQATIKEERVTFKGQQYVQGVFRMYDEKAVIIIVLNLRTYDIII